VIYCPSGSFASGSAQGVFIVPLLIKWAKKIHKYQEELKAEKTNWISKKISLSLQLTLQATMLNIGFPTVF